MKSAEGFFAGLGFHCGAANWTTVFPRAPLPGRQRGAFPFQGLEGLLLLSWTGWQRPPASLLALRYEPGASEVRDFFLIP